MGSIINPGVETQIREWKTYLLRRNTVDHVDVDELEDHLRSEMSQLGAAGLDGDESFLVAIKRMGGFSLAKLFNDVAPVPGHQKQQARPYQRLEVKP